MEAGGNLGDCLAQARHQWEGRWGSTTLEVPVSRVCRTPSFRWFLVHLLLELPRLREVYNRVVHAYRRANHIRNTAHPVPDLAAEGPWIEAPFWIWSRDDPRRRHLYACRRAGTLQLTDRRGREVELPLGPGDDPGPAVARLEEIERQGVKVRSRALITTLWSRLVLSDLFLHGIGGGKYDQVTDALIAVFFDLEPLRFMVLSATLHLPIAHRTTTADDLRAVQQRLRELTWHPELYAQKSGGSLPDPAELIAAKRAWIRTQPTPEKRASPLSGDPPAQRASAALRRGRPPAAPGGSRPDGPSAAGRSGALLAGICLLSVPGRNPAGRLLPPPGKVGRACARHHDHALPLHRFRLDSTACRSLE